MFILDPAQKKQNYVKYLSFDDENLQNNLEQKLKYNCVINRINGE